MTSRWRPTTRAQHISLGQPPSNNRLEQTIALGRRPSASFLSRLQLKRETFGGRSFAALRGEA